MSFTPTTEFEAAYEDYDRLRTEQSKTILRVAELTQIINDAEEELNGIKTSMEKRRLDKAFMRLHNAFHDQFHTKVKL